MFDVESYITSIDGNLKPIVVTLQKIIKSASCDFTEEIKWNVPTYSINKNICSIMAHKKHVNLQLFRGADIEGAEILLGSGKAMRHIKFETLGDVEAAIVIKVIKQAIVVDQA